MGREILAMIESVDPSDTAKLDEIDARVWCFKNNSNYIRYIKTKTLGLKVFFENNGRSYSPQYTRSRDALKAIRPEGWLPTIGKWANGWIASYFPTKEGQPRIEGSRLPTEELAELHAIIQAIEYERTNG